MASPSSKEDTPLGDLAQRLDAKADGGAVSVGELLETTGSTSYGPLFLLLALVTITPVIGGIPGVSIVTGVMVVLLGGQMLVSRGRPWIPKWIRRRSIGSGRLKKALAKSRPVLDWIDRLPRPRLTRFLQQPWTTATAAGITAMGVLFFPLTLVPWGVLAPGIALLISSLGLVGRDGLLVGAGLVAMTVASGISIYLTYTILIA